MIYFLVVLVIGNILFLMKIADFLNKMGETVKEMKEQVDEVYNVIDNIPKKHLVELQGAQTYDPRFVSPKP